MLSNKKLEAIKILIDIDGMGLLDAKRFCEINFNTAVLRKRKLEILKRNI